MTGYINFFNDLQGLRTSTAILEALDWDEKKFEIFLDELKLMLIAAPPNVDKALFWLRSTPWDTFDKQLLPESVYLSLEKSFRMWESKMKRTLNETRKTSKPSRTNYDARWSDEDERN